MFAPLVDLSLTRWRHGPRARHDGGRCLAGRPARGDLRLKSSTTRLVAACAFGAAFSVPADSAVRDAPFGRLVPFAPIGVARDAVAFRLIAFQEAERAQLPYDLVDAVMKVESDYQPDRIGGVGEIGLMQVRPTTAAMLGFAGDDRQLADPAVNIHFGATYLGRAWRLAGGNVCRALMKYRAGHGEEAMSALSASYCERARAHLVAMRSPLAATIKPSDLVADVGSPQSEARPSGRGFWASFQARIRKVNARLEAKWRRADAD